MVITPISLATTFARHDVGVHQGYDYSRTGNATRTALDEQIAALKRARALPARASHLSPHRRRS